MPRHLVLGTAGHIDHGKTALVRALTGTDCDRLPQEQQRGITIDIGFARLDVDDCIFGIVDVPGHERFIRNMLAGVCAIDLALLVVSSVESVKAQTREHLEILRLLGLRHGVIALTKCDLVDADTLELVELEVREAVSETFLAEAPLVHTSAQTGQGIDHLKDTLVSLASGIPSRQEGSFRMSVDRAFVVQGYGTVVTGTAYSGQLRVGEEVEWQPLGQKVRVRGLQSHGEDVDTITAGQRVAINLAGVAHGDIARGHELIAPGSLRPNRVHTVRLQTARELERPLKHRTPIRYHVGTAEHMGALNLLDCDALLPGQEGLAQLFLEEPAISAWGQRFVIRDSSGENTLGGGVVLQPGAPKIRRRHLETLERLEQLASDDSITRASAVAWLAGFHGATAAEIARTAGIQPSEMTSIRDTLIENGSLRLSESTDSPRLLHTERAEELDSRILAELGKMHEESPLMTSHDRLKLHAKLDYIGGRDILDPAIDQLILMGKLTADGSRIALSDFKPKLTQNQRKLREKIIARHQEAGLQPPDVGDFVKQAGGIASSLGDLFDVCVAEGHLVRITDETHLASEAEAELRHRVKERLSDGSGITVAELRDLLGVTRKHAVPFCEYLDRIGFTRRSGDQRFLMGGDS